MAVCENAHHHPKRRKASWERRWRPPWTLDHAAACTGSSCRYGLPRLTLLRWRNHRSKGEIK